MADRSQLGRMSVGDLLDAGFRLYRSHFLTFLGIVALPQLALAILWIGGGRGAAVASLGRNTPPVNYFVYNSALFLAYGVAVGLSAGAIANATAHAGQGKRIGILNAYRFSVWRYASLAAASALSWVVDCLPILILVALTPRLIRALMPADFFGPFQALLLLIIWIMILLLLSPIWLFLTARVLLCAQAIVLERLGPAAGLLRSWRLTTGSTRRIIVLVVSLALFTGLFGAILPLALFSNLGPTIVQALTRLPLDIPIGLVIAALPMIVVLPIPLAAHAALYNDLRAREAQRDATIAITGLNK